MSDYPGNPFHSQLLMTETVRLIEQSCPREDGHLMREVFERFQGREERIINRALLLAHDLALQADMERWKELIRYTGVALVILAVIVGMGIAASVTSQHHLINAPYALVLALGPHFLALLLWLMTLTRPTLSQGNSLGSVLLRIAARLPIRRGRHFWTVLRAAFALYARKGLLPWISGVASHAFWSIVLIVVLVALALAFSFEAYRLTWETTILPPTFFISFVEISGWLPHQLGFPLPDTATLREPAAPNSDHRAWAWWLIGCITVYGLLPRLALTLLCWLVWRFRKHRLTLDLSHPYYMKLLTRFNELEPSVVLDREKISAAPVSPLTRPPLPGESSSLAMIGFELPEDLSWPPKRIESRASSVHRIAGSNQERQAVIQQLRQQPPCYLLIACHSRSSPDRGTAHFLRDAAASAVHCALLLLPENAGDADKSERWRAWLAGSGLIEIRCLTDTNQVMSWLEDGDG